MSLRSNVPNFTEGVLAMHSEEGNKGAKLVPTGIQFPPFLHVFRTLPSRLVALLYTKATDIHGPVGQARHGEINPGGNLGPQIFPNGTHIAAPGHRTVALHAGKTGTGCNKHPLVGIVVALALVNA